MQPHKNLIKEKDGSRFNSYLICQRYQRSLPVYDLPSVVAQGEHMGISRYTYNFIVSVFCGQPACEQSDFPVDEFYRMLIVYKNQIICVPAEQIH